MRHLFFVSSQHVRLWAPSQNGFMAERPQRQRKQRPSSELFTISFPSGVCKRTSPSMTNGPFGLTVTMISGMMQFTFREPLRSVSRILETVRNWLERSPWNET